MLTSNQLAVIEAPLTSKLFLHAPAGTGKSTVGIERLKFLLANGVTGDSILVITPQRTLQEPYLDIIRSPERIAGGEVTPATVGGLARRMVDLFWPLAAEVAGFAHPENPPTFLTLETAQYYMAHLVRPLLDAGYFESLTIDRNRLYSQILDNLNKSDHVWTPLGSASHPNAESTLTPRTAPIASAIFACKIICSIFRCNWKSSGLI